MAITRVTDAAGIKAVQQELQSLGYSVGKAGADGIWGRDTEAAYQSYQQGQQATQLQGMLSNAMNAANNIGAAYDAAGQQFMASQNAAYGSVKQNLESQGSKLAEQYNNLRGQAYTNARLGAIGNNEVLAAKGLAGNMYDNSVSGVSETSRITQDVGMRNNINSATTQEQTAKDEIANQIIQAGYTRDQNIANYLAEQSIAKAQAELSAQQQAIQNAMTLYEYQNSLSGKMTGGAGGPSPTNDYYAQYAKVLAGIAPTQRLAYYNDQAKMNEIYGLLGEKAFNKLLAAYPAAYPVATTTPQQRKPAAQD